MGSFSGPTDAELAWIAGHLRVMTTGQLCAAGLSEKQIRLRVAQGRLTRLSQGVYLVGAAPAGSLSLAKSASVACKGDALVSHGWGAHILGFEKTPQLPVDMTVASGSRRGRPDRIRIHRTGTLEPQDRAMRWTIPVTSAARSILGCAETYSLIRLEGLIADAFAARAVTDQQLDELAQRAGRTPAAGKLRILREEGMSLTRSEAERILRRLLKQAGLPLPVTEYRIGRYFADFAWPGHRLVVEFDGFATHGHKQAFTPDRRRGADITAKGWSVMQVTWDQLIDEPYAVVAKIAGALAVREALA